ncbi:hypothetical protein K438DRAFT_1780704 [Mycena galopus ATCC 62051]|nr:hypothetical protein K438DRAFT_1780704 [Mycena galopus ATCC 62051]
MGNQKTGDVASRRYPKIVFLGPSITQDFPGYPKISQDGFLTGLDPVHRVWRPSHLASYLLAADKDPSTGKKLWYCDNPEAASSSLSTNLILGDLRTPRSNVPVISLSFHEFFESKRGPERFLLFKTSQFTVESLIWNTVGTGPTAIPYDGYSRWNK